MEIDAEGLFPAQGFWDLVRLRLSRMFAVFLVLGGIGCVVAGLVQWTVECSREAGSCVVRRDLPVPIRREVLLENVRAWEFVRDEARGTGRTVLIEVDDAERPLPAGREDLARARHEELVALLHGERASVAYATPRTWWLVGLGGALILMMPLPYRLIVRRRPRTIDVG